MILKLKNSLIQTAGIALLLFFAGPINILLMNSNEFIFTSFSILPYILGLCVLFLLIMFIIIYMINKIFPFAEIVITAICLLLWIQGSIIIWNYGHFEGVSIDWTSHYMKGIIDSLVWLIIIGLFVKYRRVITRKYSMIIMLIIIVQSLITLQTIITYNFNNNDNSSKRFMLSPERAFKFSKINNVIIIILDKFQSDIFSDIINENPEMKNSLNGFTYYSNTTASYAYTCLAVPNILTSKMYYNNEPYSDFLKKAYNSETSVSKMLKNAGYNTEAYPHESGAFKGAEKIFFTDPQIFSNAVERHTSVDHLIENSLYLIDLSLFRHLPHFVKIIIYNDQKWFLKHCYTFTKLEFFQYRYQKISDLEYDKQLYNYHDIRFIDQMKGSAIMDSDKKEFKFYHLQGPHAPIYTDKDFNFIEGNISRENFKNQAIASLKIINLFTEKLKSIGAFDNSLIIIAGDHGGGNYKLSMKLDNGDLCDDYKISSGYPLLLIKPSGSNNKFSINNKPVSLSDIAPTILKTENINTELNNSIFDPIKKEKTVRKFYYFSYKKGSTRKGLRYLNNLYEYEISGDANDINSWKLSGKVYKSPK